MMSTNKTMSASTQTLATLHGATDNVTLEDLRAQFRRAVERRQGVWEASDDDTRKAREFIQNHRREPCDATATP